MHVGAKKTVIKINISSAIKSLGDNRVEKNLGWLAIWR